MKRMELVIQSKDSKIEELSSQIEKLSKAKPKESARESANKPK